MASEIEQLKAEVVKLQARLAAGFFMRQKNERKLYYLLRFPVSVVHFQQREAVMTRRSSRMSHSASPKTSTSSQLSRCFRARIAATVRVLSSLLWRPSFSPGRWPLSPNAIASPVLVAAVVFLSGCATGSFELVRPDGVTVRANAFALFRDTGLENFTYTVAEDEKGAGLLPSKATRNASVGASGYRGSTNIDAVIKLLEAAR